MTEVKRYYKSKYSKNFEDNYDGIFGLKQAFFDLEDKVMDKEQKEFELLQNENANLRAKIDQQDLKILELELTIKQMHCCKHQTCNGCDRENCGICDEHNHYRSRE